jgi:hypothetical protein
MYQTLSLIYYRFACSFDMRRLPLLHAATGPYNGGP